MKPGSLLDGLVRRAALAAVRSCEGDVKEAAARLGVGYSTLYGWLARWRAEGRPGVPDHRPRGPRPRQSKA